MLRSILSIIVVFYVSVVVSFAQQQRTDFDITSIDEVSENVQNQLLEKKKRKIQIYLIRHAKPNLHKSFLSSSGEAQKYIEDYDRVPIHKIDSNQVVINLKKPHQIYCSSLPRSQETALVLFKDSYLIVSDSIFREFDMKIVHATPVIKLPMDLWKGISRLAWFLGLNSKGIESRREAMKRVVLAADNLEKLASQEETAILVGHGMINAFITKELKKRGWDVVQSKGHLNLGATVLEKIVAL
ncbi:phosphoglycerate mutase family protein [Ancylomarina sp. DW003]|nr:histidine phosphatase family protein [Ancylomarina sp. DW003]MDE5424280.1 phosphoglycerate mutase family protein [Ancylomarina sp. DW003]